MKKISTIIALILFLAGCGQKGLNGSWMLDEEKSRTVLEWSTTGEWLPNRLIDIFSVNNLDVTSEGFEIKIPTGDGDPITCNFDTYSDKRANGNCYIGERHLWQSNWTLVEEDGGDKLRWRIVIGYQHATFVFTRA